MRLKSNQQVGATVRAHFAISLAFFSGVLAAQGTSLKLSEGTVGANVGNADGLYSAWIAPMVPAGRRTIPHANQKKLSDSEAAVADGVARFCAASGGVVNSKSEEHGNTYVCSDPSGKFVGSFTTTRYRGFELQVSYDSPTRVARRETQEQAIEARNGRNGPTGVATTVDGRYKLLRVGNLKERHLVEVEGTPIEQVAQLDFDSRRAMVTVTFRDGKTSTMSVGRLKWRWSSSALSSYGAGKFGLPLVIVDPETGQPYTRIFSNFDGLVSITFDDVPAWDSKSAEPIATKLDLKAPALSEQYRRKIVAEANALYAGAVKTGAIRLLPEGKLTSELGSYLRTELERIIRGPECEGDLEQGVLTLEAPMKCHAATRERVLVFDRGYALVPDITPLSTIIVLKRINSDIK